MRLPVEQLAQRLDSEPLKPVYLITGGEDLLVLEAAAEVRAAARAQGFDDRQVFDVDAQFDWAEVAGAADALSLFSTRRILDLRLPSGKPGREGGEWFRSFAERPGDDLLLITCGPLRKDQLNSAWVKALDRIGAVVQCWPVDRARLPAWLDARMRSRGLQPEAAATRSLAERVEGNLLAAAQEVEKLLLLKGPGPVGVDDIQSLVADSARFDVFRLVDSALTGEPARALRMTRSLRAEGVMPSMIVWAFARELRLVCKMRRLLNDGQSMEPLMRRENVWDRRKQSLQQAMRRHGLVFWEQALAACSMIDRMIRGQHDDDPWQALERLALKVARAVQR